MSSPNDVGTSGKGRVTWREFADLMCGPPQPTHDDEGNVNGYRRDFLPAAQRTPAKIAALYGQQTAAKVVAMGAVSSAPRREPAPRPREQRGCAGNTRIRGSRRSSSSSAGGGDPGSDPDEPPPPSGWHPQQLADSDQPRPSQRFRPLEGRREWRAAELRQLYERQMAADRAEVDDPLRPTRSEEHDPRQVA